MNLLIRELKANRKSLIFWSIGMFLLITSSMGKYAGMSASGQSINDLMAQMPKSLQGIWGIGTFDLTTIIGYYGVLFVYLVVMATIHAAMLGSNIISKEERDKTAEFLLSKPISRINIIAYKLVAAIVNIAIFNLVTLVSSVIMVNTYGNGENVTGDIGLLMAGLFILQLMFLFIGTAIAAISKNPKRATSLSTGILLITFILSIAIEMNEKLLVLRYLTPFKYFEAKNLLFGGGFDVVYTVLSMMIIVLLISVTFIFYRQRDLNV